MTGAPPGLTALTHERRWRTLPPAWRMSITLPAYIQDVAKVQMWCAWAEVVLGEASFAKPVAMMK